MTAVGERSPAQEREQRAATWLEDLRWHKQMFQQSRFRWTGEHVMAIVTRHTGGQLDFTTVAHLRSLERYRLEVSTYGHQCRLAMADPLLRAQDTLGNQHGPASEVPGAQWGPGGENNGRRWGPTGAALGLSVIDCSATVWSAADPTAVRTNVNVKRVLSELPFRNPLIEAWELKQLWRMYEAAADVLEDTAHDLVAELSATRPIEVLAEALGQGGRGLQANIKYARDRRGGPGDPRRIPTQVF